ncbi:unnamed protein product, partial [Closterium sp. NIES-54]
MSALRSSSCLLLFPSSPRLLVYSSPHFFVSGALGLGVTSHLQVRGADSDNLALTRVVQRDVWEWQFPPSCVNRRLLVVPWPEDQWHGMGSQVHIMAVLLSVALSSNRILVPLPASYGRANSSHCHGQSHYQPHTLPRPTVSRPGVAQPRRTSPSLHL